LHALCKVCLSLRYEATLRSCCWRQLPESEAAQRLAWVREMRAQLSPPGMLADDGSINQEFFKPKTVRRACKEMLARK